MLQAATHLDTLISERAIRSVFALQNDVIVFPIWYHPYYGKFEHYFATSTSRFFKAVPGRRPVELFGRIQSTGYIQLHLGIDGESVCELAHRLLYRLFVGEIPNGWYVVHSDGCRTNNAIENLEAIDPEQCRKISRPSADPMTTAELAQVVAMTEMGFRTADIARVLDRTHRQISNIRRRCLADKPLADKPGCPFGRLRETARRIGNILRNDNAETVSEDVDAVFSKIDQRDVPEPRPLS